jgi:hypothetical protein
MPAELIPSPAEKPDEKTTKKRASKSTDQPTGQEETAGPKTGPRRAPQMPGLAELVEQLRQLSGLATLGFLSPATANIAFRCISKTTDIVIRCQTATPGAPNQPGLVAACRENPKLVPLLESLLTDDQLSELMRQITDEQT